MREFIACWFGRVRAWSAPRPPGRHARAHQRSAEPVKPSQVTRVPRRMATLLDGEALPIVRPYVLAHEQRQQRQRRRALMLATMGVDVGPHTILGVEVAR